MFAEGNYTASQARHEEHVSGHSSSQQLSTDEAIALLQQSGVKGSLYRLERAVTAFRGSDLNIKLLASYLTHWFRGDVRKLDTIPIWRDVKEEGRQTRRLLAAHAVNLKDSRELSALYFMSLFDKPISQREMQTILASTRISFWQRLFPKNPNNFAGVFAPVAGRRAKRFGYVLNNLKSLALIPSTGDTVSTPLVNYPIVQRFFKKQFRTRYPQAWMEANQQLARYFVGQANGYYPESKEELLLLMQAIKHLCAIGDYQTALVELYWKRIRREEAAYITRAMRAYDIDLYIIANFFKGSWQQPIQNISTGFKILLLKWAQEDLIALKRPREAIDVLEAMSQQFIKQKKWSRAVSSTKQIRQIYLTLGKVQRAIDAGRQSIVYADLGSNPTEFIRCLLELVKILHDHDRPQEAAKLFQQAERAFKTADCDQAIKLEMEKLRNTVRIIRGTSGSETKRLNATNNVKPNAASQNPASAASNVTP